MTYVSRLAARYALAVLVGAFVALTFAVLLRWPFEFSGSMSMLCGGLFSPLVPVSVFLLLVLLCCSRSSRPAERVFNLGQ